MTFNEGWKKAEYFLEQGVIAKWRDGREIKFTIKISKPVLAESRDNELCWECWLMLEGLYEPFSNPITGVSSFQAMVWALDSCKQLMQEKLKGARLFKTGGEVLGEELFPKDGMTLVEFFMLD